MPQVKITVVQSHCRASCMKQGDCFLIGDVCPPICHELWNCAYPMVYTLLNGGMLDYGAGKAPMFDLACPDGSRVVIHGERI
ncbi:TIGR04076 family protein [Caproicibacterium amylolyticum]|jgi:uncharacterized repeat protein (TIGR04076 family)|uniref:TIGR04076 family protein n=1 Tax=Caproicibacterium amylolyticum TaxID=2766537 RepID=A0A7G9WFP6_9FIRM|nr:TIGR04076 family protein [Caproicibacterium amylolyticum]MBE6722786.1 TIGR04076 family protein [Oscillospiraceae bacterium]QNO17508.1 TIGR04076 family protein [Caproicibacterium amylolyticum]